MHIIHVLLHFSQRERKLYFKWDILIINIFELILVCVKWIWEWMDVLSALWWQFLLGLLHSPHHIYHIGCRNESCVFLSIFACLLCCLQDMCLIFGDPWHICYLGGSGSIKVMTHGISNQSALIGNKFRLSTKKISKPHTTLPWWEKPPVIGGFPSQRASNTDNISMSWHLHGGGDPCLVCYPGGRLNTKMSF